MTYYSVPMLLDVFRLTTNDHRSTVEAIVAHLRKRGGGFNYNRAATFQRKAYQGYRNFESLYQQCLSNGRSVSLRQNAAVLKLIAELSAKRVIQTFDFPRRKLTLAKDIHSPLGPNFFFIENGVVKLFYLHCRCNFRGDVGHLAMLAAEYKLEILENDFFGLRADVEIVDVAPRDNHGTANVTSFNLAKLDLPDAKYLKSRIDTFVRAFMEVEAGRLAGEVVTISRKSREDQPRFDL